MHSFSEDLLLVCDIIVSRGERPCLTCPWVDNNSRPPPNVCNSIVNLSDRACRIGWTFHTTTSYVSHTPIIGQNSFSDQDSVALTQGFLHLSSFWRRTSGRSGHTSLNNSEMLIKMVRPFCRAIGTHERLRRDDLGRLFREGELTELSSLSFC